MNKQTKDAALQVATGIAVSLCILMMFSKMDLASVKEKQRIERAFKYINFAHTTVINHALKTGAPYPPTQEQELPEQVTKDFAMNNGDSPYFHEEGRYSRLDFFAGKVPFSAPLKYYVEGQKWVIVSLGPDQDLDWNAEAPFPAESEIPAVFFDPTNGVASSGDLLLWDFSRE